MTPGLPVGGAQTAAGDNPWLPDATVFRSITPRLALGDVPSASGRTQAAHLAPFTPASSDFAPTRAVQ